MEIEKTAQQIVKEFEGFNNWEDRYREIIQFAKKLEPMEEEYKIDKYRVKGCQSQVWLYPQLEQGILNFKADSDSLLVKGIVALLLEVYNKRSPSEIQNFRPDFLKEIGITEHLSMNRTNGLSAMVKQIQMYALAFNAIKQ